MTTRTVQLLPDQLSARVTTHEVARGDEVIPCATWRSEGLAAMGHPELTLTLRRAAGSDESSLSLDAIRFFIGVHGAAQEGKALGVGTLGEFPAGLFDGAEPHGFVCLHPGFTRDPEAPARGLRVVVLHRDELALASAYGPRRVLARLAREARYAPYPPWWDADRASVAHPDDATTALADALRVRVLDAAAWRGGDDVTLRLAPSSREGLRAAVTHAREAPRFALVVDAPADADAWLVWTPGQRGVSAASRAGSRGERVAGNFVLVARGEGEPSGGHAEDGFAFALDDGARTAFLDALAGGGDFALPAGPRSKGLRVVWAEAEALPEPVPAARYVGVEALAGLGARPTVEREAFTRYARAVCAAIDDHFAETWAEPGHDLMVHVELHPRRRPAASVALRPGVTHPTLNGLCARVEGVDAPEVTGAAVFRVEFALWGGAS
jgi:hypothetical protein